MLKSYVRKILSMNGIKELYRFQEEAIKEVLSGKSVVVSAPTGSGKTLVAEVSLAYSFFEKKKKGIYIAPLRSLVYEKQVDFAKLKKLNIDVVASTGEIWLYKRDIEQADVLLSTIEKFDSIVRHNPSFWDYVGVLVVDEIHTINDGKRGAILEQLLVEAYRRGIQIVGLSATVGNLEYLAHWLDAEIIYSNERRVVLECGVFYNGRLEWDYGKVEELSKDWIRALVLPIVEKDKSVLIFVNRRKEAERLARKIAEYMGGGGEGLSGLIDRGVAYHHAGLGKDVRRYVERLFRNKKIKVLVATTTLAYGVNLPAYRVIIKGINKFDGGVVKYYDINEILQMMGRAGRPKYDTKGEAIVVVMSRHLVDVVKEKYFAKIKQSVTSRMLDYLEDVVLRMFVIDEVLTFDEIIERLKCSFWYYLMVNDEFLRERVKNVVYNLVSSGFIDIVDVAKRMYAITEFGKIVGQLCIMVRTAGLLKVRVKEVSNISDFIASFINTPDMFVLSVKKEELVDLEAVRHIVEIPTYVQVEPGRIYKEVKAYLVLMDWIAGKSKSYISRRHNVQMHDVDVLVEHASWLAHSMYRIAEYVINDEELIETFKKYKRRVEEGATEEMLELMLVDGITRDVARILVKSGVKTRVRLYLMKPKQLIELGVPRRVVARIFGVSVDKVEDISRSKSLFEFM